MNWSVWCFVALPIVLSPFMMLVLRVTAEHGKPNGLLNPKIQSWAFLFGDSIALPVAFGAAASWGHDASGLWSQGIGIFVSLVTAAVISGGFRHFDAQRYRASGNADRLLSPTKWWHDFVVYPILVTILVYLGIPVLVHHFGSVHCWLMLAGIAAWLAFGVIDITIIKPDPARQHPRWQDTWLLRLIEWRLGV